MAEVFHDYTEVQINTNLASSEHVFAIYEKNMGIVGCCYCLELMFGKYKVGGIGGVCIRKDRRGNGLGVNLIEYVIEDLAYYDAFLVWTRVQNFFQRCSFVDFSEGIEIVTADSTPMIRANNKELIGYSPFPKWRRIKF